MSLQNILANKNNTDNTVANFVQKAFHLLSVPSTSLRTPNTTTSYTGSPMDSSSSSKIQTYFKRLFYPNTSDTEMFIVSSDRYTSSHSAQYVWIPKIKEITNKTDLLPSKFPRGKGVTSNPSSQKNKKLGQVVQQIRKLGSYL